VAGEALAEAAALEVALRYVAATGAKPAVYTYDRGPGLPVFTGTTALHRVAMHDARPLAASLSLDLQGFQLLRHASATADFYDEAEVRAVYYRETEALVQRLTGAARVLMFDHTLRSSPRAGRGAGVREPVRAAHNDYTHASAPQRLRDLLPKAEAEPALRRRYALINVWRPVRGPVEEAPLAACDARTIAPQDLIATDMVYPDRVGEVWSLAHNPAHRWYWFPRMRTDEVMLLKCYDSAGDGRARFAAHTAFDDPTTPPGAAPRQSIEARTLALFD
jgi:hypothetical protein